MLLMEADEAIESKQFAYVTARKIETAKRPNVLRQINKVKRIFRGKMLKTTTTSVPKKV